MLCKRQRGRLTVKLENVPIFSGRNEKINDNYLPQMAEEVLRKIIA